MRLAEKREASAVQVFAVTKIESCLIEIFECCRSAVMQIIADYCLHF